jgi:hypothetical protein
MSTIEGRVRKKDLATLNTDDFTDLQDQRAAHLGTIAGPQDPDFLAVLESVFQGTGLMSNKRKAELLVRVHHEVDTEWRRASQSFVSIAKSMVELENTLSPEENRRLKRSTDRIFPFSDAIASKFRKIGRAVISGTIDETLVPGSYTVAYQIAVMDAPTLEDAKRRNLVRPDVTREEIVAFRKEVAEKQSFDQQPAWRIKPQQERKDLLRQQARLTKELDRVNARIAELDRTASNQD